MRTIGVYTMDHGFDDIGALQPTGVISAAELASGRFAGKTVLTDTAHGLKKGTPIVVAGTTSYNGLVRVLAVINANKFVIDKAFVATETGTWAQVGGASAWCGFMPIGADLPASAITTLTFWLPELQSGDEKDVDYTKDKIYPFPGIIKTVQISSGNLRLIRASTLSPRGKTS